MSLVVKEFNFNKIRVRESNRYVSATDMAKASGKLFGHWNELKSTKEFLKACESAIGIPIMELNKVLSV